MEEIIEDSTLGGYFVQDRDRTEISREHLRLLEQEARDYYEPHMQGYDSHLEQIRVDTTELQNTKRNSEARDGEISDMITDLS